MCFLTPTVLMCATPRRGVVLLHAEMIAALLWICGAFHGLIIDYACIRYSFDVTCYFMLTTLAGALTNGFIIRYVYEIEGEW